MLKFGKKKVWFGKKMLWVASKHLQMDGGAPPQLRAGFCPAKIKGVTEARNIPFISA
jgi:hypothetical protein